MERLATKTPKEREDEETERLVRDSPKVKPPRHDKRRERVEPDKDEDLDQKDEDLSKNYKDIGGSIHSAKEKLISVRLKADPKQVVQITKETLKKEPSKYEEIKPKEEPEPKEEPTGEPEGDEAKLSEEARKRQEADIKAAKSFAAMRKEDPQLDNILKDFLNEDSVMGVWAKSGPETTIDPKAHLQGRTPPKGVKTFGDLLRVLKTPIPKEEAAKPKAVKPGKLPKKIEVEIPETAPGAPDRPFSKDELKEAHTQLIETFPTDVAVDLMLVKPAMHPDEIYSMVADYNAAKALPIELKDVNKLATKLKSFTLDPNKVPAPRMVETASGKRKQYDKLPEDQKPEALRRHQIQTLAMNLAAREAVARTFEKEAGAPKELAEELASFTLSRPPENPEDRQKRSVKKADQLFYKGLESTDPKPVPPETVEKIMTALKKDPSAKRVAVGYFQAMDYQEARKKFLDPDSEDHISEYQPPKVIAKRLGKAMDFLRERSDRYPEGTTSQDTPITFKLRVTTHLNSLMPQKRASIQEFLDKEDNRYYDEAIKKWKAAKRKYQTQRKRAQKAFEKAMDKYKTLQNEGKAPPDLPLSTNDRLAKSGIFEPREPRKPPRYDVHRKKPEELEASAKDLWKAFHRRASVMNSMAARVLGRFLIYSNTSAMGTNRQAVYWGVEPEEVKPYRGWQQPRGQDLTEREFTTILASARKWLTAPVLTVNIEGVPRDTQYRAALDLAIRTEGYDRIIHPLEYNKMLARLAGAEHPQDETLLTDTDKLAREQMSKKVEFDTSTADRILARLDRVASTVQEHHEKWGMKFEDAKELVNEIDRVADELELAAYGEMSMTARQAEILKKAEVIQREGDEPYMDTFGNPQQPRQVEADEPYMDAYRSDDSSGVHHGESTTGRPLAP